MTPQKTTFTRYLYSNGVYTSLDYPGAASTEAVGINNSGIISGGTLLPMMSRKAHV